MEAVHPGLTPLLEPVCLPVRSALWKVVLVCWAEQGQLQGHPVHCLMASHLPVTVLVQIQAVPELQADSQKSAELGLGPLR